MVIDSSLVVNGRRSRETVCLIIMAVRNAHVWIAEEHVFLGVFLTQKIVRWHMWRGIVICGGRYTTANSQTPNIIIFLTLGQS